MSLRSLVRFWRPRSSPRRRWARARRKLWVEVLEDRTLPAGGPSLLGNAGLNARPTPTSGTLNTGQPLPPETPLPFDPSAGTASVSAASLAFATGLYDDLLHRAPQPSEAASWAAALDAGQSHQAVAQGFTLGD